MKKYISVFIAILASLCVGSANASHPCVSAMLESIQKEVDKYNINADKDIYIPMDLNSDFFALEMTTAANKDKCVTYMKGLSSSIKEFPDDDFKKTYSTLMGLDGIRKTYEVQETKDLMDFILTMQDDWRTIYMCEDQRSSDAWARFWKTTGWVAASLGLEIIIGKVGAKVVRADILKKGEGAIQEATKAAEVAAKAAGANISAVDEAVAAAGRTAAETMSRNIAKVTFWNGLYFPATLLKGHKIAGPGLTVLAHGIAIGGSFMVTHGLYKDWAEKHSRAWAWIEEWVDADRVPKGAPTREDLIDGEIDQMVKQKWKYVKDTAAQNKGNEMGAFPCHKVSERNGGCYTVCGTGKPGHDDVMNKYVWTGAYRATNGVCVDRDTYLLYEMDARGNKSKLYRIKASQFQSGSQSSQNILSRVNTVRNGTNCVMGNFQNNINLYVGMPLYYELDLKPDYAIILGGTRVRGSEAR